MPPPVPPRRLFQVPDAFAGNLAYTTTTTPNLQIAPAASNASEFGDSYVNNLQPVASALNVANLPSPAIGALQPYLYQPGLNPYYFSFSANGYPSIVSSWSAGNNNGVTAGLPSTVVLGYNPPQNNANAAIDNRQHPQWRLEMMQRAINLTTPRTHQYAVWITIGFFEVKRQGDLGNLAQAIPTLAFDVFGPENGSLTGTAKRFRGFFLVNRLNLTGFNPGSPGSFRTAVTYRHRIQ
jgi:large repetitive protein